MALMIVAEVFELFSIWQIRYNIQFEGDKRKYI